MGAEFREDEKVLAINGGDGCTTLQMPFMLLNCQLQMVKMVNFMLGLFAANFLKSRLEH